MSFYATVMHHSVISYWEELKGAKTLLGAKRKATKLYGNGYYGHVIHIVECRQQLRADRLGIGKRLLPLIGRERTKKVLGSVL